MKDAAEMAVQPLGLSRRESVLERRLSLKDVLDVPTFSDLVKSYVELYKLGIKVFDERGDKITDVKIGNGDFCAYVFSFAEGRARCTNTVGRVKDGPIAPTQGARVSTATDGAPSGLIAAPCFTGLRYLVMPIRWDGDYMGRVIFGPFMPDDLQGVPQSLKEISGDLDSAHAWELMGKVRRAPEATVARVMEHFRQILVALIAAGQKAYYASQLHIEATLDSNRELEEKNKRLEQLNTRLRDMDRLKSSFLATVSHELRTPLTSIIGYSEMLAEGLAGPLNPEQHEYARTIMDKGETLLRLITSILDISQIEAGKVRLHFEPLDVWDVIHSSLTSLKPQAQKKGVTLEDPGKGLSLRAVADKEKLRQVVVNLLANAVKFTPKGGRVTVRVSELALQPELTKPGYRVSVEDSGVGIPQAELDKIFKSFYQVDSSSTREFGGAGLGLAIVKSYVEGHGGTLRVHSQVGKGSCFTAILPETPPVPTSAEITPPASVPDRF